MERIRSERNTQAGGENDRGGRRKPCIEIWALMAALGMLLGASPTEAATVDLTWSATTGTGTPGGSAIDAAPGDELTLSVVLNLEAGESVSSLALSVEFDGDGGNELNLVQVVELNHVASFNCVPLPDCFVNFGPELHNQDFGVDSEVESQPGSAGEVNTFEMGTLDIGPSGPLSIPVGTIRFEVVKAITDGEDVDSGHFNLGFDGTFDNAANALPIAFGGAEVNAEGGTPGTPSLVATKTDAHAVDGDGDGLVEPGDSLRYTVEIANEGDADALGVSFADAPDANAVLIAGSVTTTQGVISDGNGSTDTAVKVDLGTIPAGEMVAVIFDARVADPLPDGVDRVANQGVVDGVGLPSLSTDDPDTAQVGDPTETEVVPDVVTCESELDFCSAGLSACEAELVSCDLSRDDAESALSDCEAALTQAEAELAESEAARLRALADLDDANAATAQLELDLAAAQARIAELEAEVAATEGRLDRCQTHHDRWHKHRWFFWLNKWVW